MRHVGLVQTTGGTYTMVPPAIKYYDTLYKGYVLTIANKLLSISKAYESSIHRGAIIMILSCPQVHITYNLLSAHEKV